MLASGWQLLIRQNKSRAIELWARSDGKRPPGKDVMLPETKLDPVEARDQVGDVDVRLGVGEGETKSMANSKLASCTAEQASARMWTRLARRVCTT